MGARRLVQSFLLGVIWLSTTDGRATAPSAPDSIPQGTEGSFSQKLHSKKRNILAILRGKQSRHTPSPRSDPALPTPSILLCVENCQRYCRECRSDDGITWRCSECSPEFHYYADHKCHSDTGSYFTCGCWSLT